MCQVNTFMFKEGELDGEKIMAITRIFGEAGFTNFYEYNNYRMELVNGISYDNYLQTLSQSQISNITLIEEFIDITFIDFVEKIDNIAIC